LTQPLTGERTLLSDFVDAGQGKIGFYPFGVAVYPVIPAPVGGVIVQKNSLEILTPYIAIAGLIITISTVYVIKKRKD